MVSLWVEVKENRAEASSHTVNMLVMRIQSRLQISVFHDARSDFYNQEKKPIRQRISLCHSFAFNMHGYAVGNRNALHARNSSDQVGAADEAVYVSHALTLCIAKDVWSGLYSKTDMQLWNQVRNGLSSHSKLLALVSETIIWALL